ncbi:MAG: biotin/lipoyl-binding protein [Hamadaea sp.]|nr:biotin/lipoyl-binding protein [Hamadaea sp.]
MRWIVAGAAAVAAVGTAGLLMLTNGADPAPAASGRTVERVSSGSVTAKGTVQPVSTHNLSFSVSGTVTAVAVKAGDQVVKGQVLARIDQADAKAAVAEAEEALDEAEAALTALHASASASPSACASPSARGSGGATPSTTSGSGTTGGTGGGAAACGTTAGKSPDFISSILSAKQSVNTKSAALAKAERELAGTVITAPATGKILAVSVKVGDTARSNVISLGVVSSMVVQASFSEADVVALTVGQNASVTLPGLVGQTFTAKITQIAETGTASNNLVMYAVVLTFDTVPSGVLVGQSANVTVGS